MEEEVEVVEIPTSSEPQLIAAENLPLVWPSIAPRLEAAMNKLEFVEFDLPHVLGLLQAQQAQLWIGGDGEMIAITRIGTYPNVRRLIVDFIEGINYENYTEQMEYIEHWAISLGATQAEAELRPGLEKIAKSQGWKRRRVQMYKTLNQGLH